MSTFGTQVISFSECCSVWVCPEGNLFDPYVFQLYLAFTWQDALQFFLILEVHLSDNAPDLIDLGCDRCISLYFKSKAMFFFTDLSKSELKRQVLCKFVNVYGLLSKVGCLRGLCAGWRSHRGEQNNVFSFALCALFVYPNCARACHLNMHMHIRKRVRAQSCHFRQYSLIESYDDDKDLVHAFRVNDSP